MIEVRNLAVTLGKKPVLSDISMEVTPGLVTAIIGPNGSGKTTLMRALSGDIPFTGDVRMNARSVSALSPREMAAIRAVLPQATTLAFPYTVREVVALGLGGLDRADPSMRFLPERALERVDLADFSGRFYQELSGGEQQRVQLARVLCQVWNPTVSGVPRYLFLDEPVSSLDIRHQLQIMQVARGFAAKGGGVLAIMHDLNLTARYADHVVMMRDGRIAADGSATEVFAEATLSRVFGCRLPVGGEPDGTMPYILPQRAEI